MGSSGLTLEAITYGGIVTKILLPTGAGNYVDVVLGFNELDSYVNSQAYFGAIVGRVAGRITGARFSLDGNDYALAANDFPNHLHGGIDGLNKKIWTATPVYRADKASSLRLTYRSAEGEEGYPGNVEIAVTYTITNTNVFLIETKATTDRATPLSLTHHGYFNLAGEGSGDIEDHILQVSADSSIPMDNNFTLLDQEKSVDGYPEDFRTPRRLGDVIPQLQRKHGALYPLHNDGALREATRLVHPPTGRLLTCSTTANFLQVYTASLLNEPQTGKYGDRYEAFAGICLECQGYANGMNASHMGDIILRQGATQRTVTAYAFSSNED
jgi:aldose 1-epimerase